MTASDVLKLRKLVASRDQDMLGAANDPEKAYQLARGVDDFVQEVLGVVR